MGTVHLIHDPQLALAGLDGQFLGELLPENLESDRLFGGKALGVEDGSLAAKLRERVAKPAARRRRPVVEAGVESVIAEGGGEA